MANQATYDADGIKAPSTFAGKGIEEAADRVGDRNSDIGVGVADGVKKPGSALDPFDQRGEDRHTTISPFTLARRKEKQPHGRTEFGRQGASPEFGDIQVVYPAGPDVPFVRGFPIPLPAGRRAGDRALRAAFEQAARGQRFSPALP
ncbi:hypothetical protein [Streptomyces sp. NPDC060035]|uniref:hypothetical protein n=1 Tax=Streptomyces sp. NPDC060035 TaxID=3347044 RepID=UPI003679EFEA